MVLVLNSILSVLISANFIENMFFGKTTTATHI